MSDHLFKVFDMGEEEHDIILQKIQESKVRHFVQILSELCHCPLGGSTSWNGTLLLHLGLFFFQFWKKQYETPIDTEGTYVVREWRQNGEEGRTALNIQGYFEAIFQ